MTINGMIMFTVTTKQHHYLYFASHKYLKENAQFHNLRKKGTEAKAKSGRQICNNGGGF
jgi:hypothetical protein